MTINKYLRYISIGSLFLIPFVALIVSTNLFFPYITGKNFAFRILVEIMLVSWGALAFRDPAYRPRWKSPIILSLLTFIAIVFLADLFGEYFYKSFWSNFERMEGFITFLHLLVFFFVSTCILRTERIWRSLFQTFFGVSIIIGLIGVYQHLVSGISRVDGTLGNSTYLGALMLFNIFLLFFFLMRKVREKSAKWKLNSSIYGLIILFDAYVLVITGTRGAFLGVLGGIIFIAVIFAFSKKEDRAIRYAGGGLIALIVLAFILTVSLQNTSVIKNNPSISRLVAPVDAVLTFHISAFLDTEGIGRLLIWQAALNGFKERPILGWGQENFNYIFNKYYTPDMYGQEQWFDRSHNVILDWLTQAGILGLLSYLSLFGMVIYSIWKRKGQNNFSLEDKTILTGLLIAYFIHNFFVFDNITSYILFFSTMAYVNRIQYESLEKSKSWNIHPDIANYALAPIVIIIALSGLYFSVWRPYIASANIINALGAEQSGNLTDISNYFHRAVNPHTFGAPEAREQILQIVPSVAAAPSIDTPTKQAFLTFASNEMQDQLKRTPNDARYFLFYGFALDRLGNLAAANTYLQRAHALSPQKQTILFELAYNYLAQGQLDKALSIFKEAYDSAPAYDEARVNYIVGLIYDKKLSDALALIKTGDATVLGDNSILNALYQNKQYQIAINIYQLREAASSTDPQNYLGSAGFYLVENDQADAIAELKKLETVLTNPSDLTTIEGYITQIKAGKNPLPINSQ